MAGEYLTPTPYANPLTGLSNDMIQGLLNYMKDKQRTQQMQGLAGLLESTGIPKTVERAAYADSPKALLDTLTNVNRANVPLLKPETADAIMNVAPLVGPAARVAERGAMAAGRAGERVAEKYVPQIMEAGGLPAQLLGDLSQGSIRPMDVWHGTPHKFDAFDASKIGTGEGAQAFGHGLYLGEARGTGETYRKQLAKENLQMDLGSKLNLVDIGGTPLTKFNVDQSPELLEAAKAGKTEFVDLAKSKLGRWEDLTKDESYPFPDYAKEKVTAYKGLLDEVKNKDVSYSGSGYLYKVDLPDEAIANMLDWDKPVSKQTNVMNALRSEAEQRVRDRKLGEIENEIRTSLPKQEIGDDYLSMFSDANVVQNQDIQAQALSKLNKMNLKSLVDKELDSMKPVDMNWNMTGKEFYAILSGREGGAPRASEIMQKQGVPGIRYLDQGSRVVSGGELLDVFKTPSGWKSKIKVTNRPGVGFDTPTDTFTTSMPFKTEDEARQWAQDKISGGTSNFVVFPGNEDLLKIKEINDRPYEQWFPKANLLETAEPKAAQSLLDTSYRGSHTAPGPDFGAPLYDLTGGGQMYPADVYSSKAAQYYGTGYPKADKEAFALANKVRGNPDAEVTMYRAVPKDASIESINKGDWVTLSKDYAKNHGESVLDDNYKIISQKVKAKDLWTNADSIHEFGYWPE